MEVIRWQRSIGYTTGLSAGPCGRLVAKARAATQCGAALSQALRAQGVRPWCPSTRWRPALKPVVYPMKETVQMYYLHDSSYTQRKLCITRATLAARISTAHRLLAADWTAPKPRATYDLKRSWD